MTILITGAAKRIGAGLANLFSQKGWNILLHYFTSINEIKTLSAKINNNNGNAKFFSADLRKSNDIVSLFEYAEKEFGKIDVLINNAAIFPEKIPLKDISVEHWNNVININLTSQLLLSQQFAKQYSKYNENNGKIINFASIGGLKFWKNNITYNISKSAVINLTKSLALELAPTISVNCICPGIIAFTEDKKQPITKLNIPMERYGTIEDICEAAYFFTTCSNYITGQILSIDGGLSIK